MEGKISHTGLLARSPEGHAARGMQIKGNEDLWVEIQANTFRNWVNEHLPKDLRVLDLSQDLCTGVTLCALVEALQGKPIKPSWNKRPVNQHHYLENVTCALKAIEDDGIKLVNIGNVDIVNGNLKLILGLIWSLIVRYQIGRSKFPPRKLMLAWLQAVLPECKVSNLTTDWNTGVLLSALVDYCRPGLFPHWRKLDKANGIENCRRAMEISQKELGIPAVLEPEYLASPWLDELSGMTYLSYFMKPGSPGFYATLRWVNSRLERPIKNFTSDWNDGKVISEIIRSLGGSAAAPEKLKGDPAYWEANQSQAIEAGKKLGVQPILSAKDLADRHVEHLGVMAYAAHFQWVPERPPLHDLIAVTLESTSGRVGQPTHFQVSLLDTTLSYSSLSVEIRAPDNKTYQIRELRQGRGSFVPSKPGMHELVVKFDGEEAQGGHFFRVLPALVEVAPPGMAPCALGSLVQVLVNATGAPRREDILVTAYSPSGRPVNCPLTVIDGTNSATFKPDEAGEWRIEITYQGKQIQGGPFTCSVFDPSGVRVTGLEGALPLVPHVVDLDCHSCGVPGEVTADVVRDKRSIRSHVEKIDEWRYRVRFTAKEAGKHRLYVYFNGYDVKGSPFIMRVGTQRKSKSSSNTSPNSTFRTSPTNRYASSSPVNSSLNTSKNTSYNSYSRQSASPSFVDETHKFAQDYHMKSVSEKRMTSGSPSYNDRHSPSYPHRAASPYNGPPSPYRNGSPSYNPSPSHGRDSPDYITSRKLNEKRFESSPSPSFTKKNEYDTNYASKMSSMRISDSRSPVFMERSSPEVGNYSTSRYEKRVESRSYNSYNDGGGVDTSPIIKVSSISDNAAGRRDSWDAINKTRNILSERSLESVANLTESQLDSELRRKKAEEHSRFASNEQSYRNEQTYRNESSFKSNYSQKYVSDNYGRDSPVYKSSSKGGNGGASAIRVQPVPDGILGQPVEFEIDGSGAGSGDLEILVEGGRVTSSVRSLGGQRFRAAFTPHQALPHRVDIKFNGETVPGSPWHVSIMPPLEGAGAVSVLGESTRLVPAHRPAVFEIVCNSPTIADTPPDVRVTAPGGKRAAKGQPRVSTARPGVWRVEFVPTEVGTHLIEVEAGGEKLPCGPLVAKVKCGEAVETAKHVILDCPALCRRRSSYLVVIQEEERQKKKLVSGSCPGGGKIEISINEGEVPNHVQVVGGGRCLVSFTPDQAKPHLIDIKFNGETVRGCPFVCTVTDTSRVTLSLSHLELIPVNQPSSFHMGVAGGGAAELAVASNLFTAGGIHSGFTAEFTPVQVGAHQITVDYNGRPVQGTPFIAKAFDSNKVTVGTVAKGTVGRPVTFSVDASEAGEGNLEITISARGMNIPTQVHPQGNARFAVSFVPIEACDHVVNVAFNKRPVVGCPLIVGVGGGGTGPTVTLPGPGPIHKPSTLLVNHPGRLEDIEVNVEGPGGQAVPTQVQPIAEGQFRAEFVPRVVGEHRVAVSVKGQPVAGSPFAAKAYDVNAIRVKEPARGVVGKPVTFLVETSQAGPGNLEVTVNGGLVPTSAQAQGPHTYAISFTPREPSVHSVELRFNGQDVPGSPFRCNVSPAARIIAPEALDKVSVGRPCTFTVESPAPPTVEVLGPARRALVTKNDMKNLKAITGKSIPLHSTFKPYNSSHYQQVTPQENAVGKFEVTFTPLDVGDHSVEVQLPSGHVEGSPFLIKAYDANRVTVTDIMDGVVGKPVSFSINASQAGAGNLEIIVAVGGRNVPNFVQTGEPQVIATAPTGKILPTKLIVNDDTYIARFVPETVGRHSVAILINDQHVIGSPFSCNVYDVNKVIVTGLPGRKGDITRALSEISLRELGPAEVGKPVTFSVDAAQAGEGTLELVVSTQHTTIKAEVVACARGLYDVTFVPLTAEDHFVNITFNEMTVTGSPFHCTVIESTQYFQVGSTAYIDLPSDSHRIEISDPNNHHVKYVVNNYKGEFNLTQTGTYRVHIIKDNEVIATRTLHVFDTTKIDIINAPEAVCHRPAVIGINMTKVGPGKLTAAIKVGNREVAHSVRQSPSNMNMWEIVFHPTQAAPHRVTLFYNGVPKFGVLEVPVKGPGNEPWAGGLGLYQARIGKVTSFHIETMGRPGREFDVVVSGPTGSAVPVRCYQTKTGKLQAEFTTREVGAHKVEVLHQGKHLAGSPFTCQAFDPDNVRIVDIPTSQGNVGEKVYFNVSTKSCGFTELEIQVTNPIHQTLAVHQTPIDDKLTQVMFQPSMAGLYQVAVTYGGVPVKGSPLALGVGPVGPTPPPRAVGRGLEAGRIGERCSFAVSSVVQPRVTVEAVEGSVEPHVLSPKPGEYVVTYTPKWVGVYDVVVMIGPNELPGSPFHPTIVDPSAVRVIGGWSQHLDDAGRIRLPAKLAFDTGNAGPGPLECTLAGRKVAGEKSGDRVRIAGFPLPEAPSSVVCVGDQVVLTGKGLAQAQCGEPAVFTIDGSKASSGNPEVTLQAADTNIPVPVMISLAGREIRSWIDTRRAGPGELTAHCAGPRKVAYCELYDHGDATFTLNVKPQEAGRHALTVKYAGQHVPGSPFVLKVAGAPDASKVRVYGPGIEHGVLATFQSRFICDTRGAGAGQLTVRVRGPKGAFRVEMQRESQKDRTILCKYDPTEPGDYRVEVKWAGDLVPGSPFHVMIFDTQEELRRYISSL
nr:unnamed protein product [Callosobruchus chinensis]